MYDKESIINEATFGDVVGEFYGVSDTLQTDLVETTETGIIKYKTKTE